MKILDVRDGLIRFEADENVYLSSFIQIDGTDKSYLAQVNQCKAVGTTKIADARILFVIIDNELYNYDKTLPPNDAEVRMFKSDIIKSSMNVNSPIIIGRLLDNSDIIPIDSEAFNKKMLISIDNTDYKNILIKNLIKQFNSLKQKVIIIDTLGIHNEEQKYFAGKDFKLPLNTDSLKFMYKSCLDDATQESKSTIIDIFKDLADYSKTVPFVPFETLKSIVDDMVDNQHIFKLFVLKNKLAKFKQLGYFATKKSEVDTINNILNSGNCIIDLSKLDKLFLNRYLEYIYSIVEHNNDIQIIVEASTGISKKNLKHIILDSTAKTTLSTHSNYQYINDIKILFENYIVEPSNSNINTFKIYSSFFNSMTQNTYLITGKALNYIPLVSEFQEINEVLNKNEVAKVDNIHRQEEQSNEILQNTEAVTESCDNNDKTNQIFANIKEKSENVINSISEKLEDESENIDDIEIFDDNKEKYENVSIENKENNDDLESEVITNLTNDEIIEPEYNEAEKDFVIDDTADAENKNIIDEEINTNNNDDNLLISQEDENLLNTDISEEDNIITDNSEFDNNSSEEITIALNNDEDNLLQELEESNNTLDNNANVSITEEQHNDDVPIISIEENDDVLEEIVELDPSDTDNNDIIIDISEEPDNINIDEETDKQIVEDVDKVFTTIKDDENIEEFSESDLDLIDELNSDSNEEELEEFSEEIPEISDSNDNDILKPANDIITNINEQDNIESEILEKREANTPIVPVYDAEIPQEDMVESDPIQQGDSVIHAKYGNGVVEKMIKYGSKTLFSINFENIGRRLLDPTLTEIKKI